MGRHSVAHQRAMVAVQQEFVHDDETGKWYRKGQEPAEEEEQGLVDKVKETLDI